MRFIIVLIVFDEHDSRTRMGPTSRQFAKYFDSIKLHLVI